MSRKNKSEFYSIMIVPPEGRASKRFRIHRMGVRAILSSVFVLVCVVLGMVYFSAKTAMNMDEFEDVRPTANGNSPAEMRKIKHDLDRLKTDVENSLDRQDELRDDINQARHGHFGFRRRTRAEVLDRNYKQIFASTVSPEVKLKEAVALLQNYSDDNESQLAVTERQFSRMKSRFSVTPSDWPIFGMIDSDFGWRIHPITRQRQFHKGIDISAWIGSPVKTTADGVVVRTGWNGGYGMEVVVDHGYGMKTVYAHNSRILVEPGEVVRKGQEVAAAGSTGLSTGPHCHYEIQKWDQAIDPKPYLNLDIFTASKLVW